MPPATDSTVLGCNSGTVSGWDFCKWQQLYGFMIRAFMALMTQGSATWISPLLKIRRTG
jgi:hypothetical protein